MMKKKFLTVFVLVFSLFFGGCQADTKGSSGDGSTKRTYLIMDYFDTSTTIAGYEEDEARFTEVCAYIESELARYDSLYDNYTEIAGVNNLYAVNRDAGNAPVTVDEDLIRLFLLGKEIYTLTDGKTNYAMGAVLSLWHDHREEAESDPENASVPSGEELLAASEHCNIDDVIIDEDASTIYYADPELKCDVGAFAKGYAIERIAEDLVAMGVDHYSLSVGGNVYTIGTKADGSGWKIGLQNPNLDSEESYAEILRFSDFALATSGSYQRYYYVDDVKYCHIIDPDTLYPKDTFLSVSVLSRDAGIGDALSTALFNMTLEDGQALIASLDETEALWILADESKVYSDGFEAYIDN
jgi:thiamine biosynthesis lipoprotein